MEITYKAQYQPAISRTNGETKIVNTRFEIGDRVIVKEVGSTMQERMKYYLDERDENGYKKCIVKDVIYTVNDIELSLASGKVSYRLSYSDPHYIFPAGARNATEDQIIAAVIDE